MCTFADKVGREQVYLFAGFSMSEVAVIVIVWAILFIIAFVFIPAWRRHHDAGRGFYAKTSEDNQAIINATLKSLNCTCKWVDEQDGKVVRYDYQSGHFCIHIEKDSPYIRLSYFFFFTTDTDHIELVRMLCNQCNLNTETCRIVYSLNKENDEVHLHLISGLLLNESAAKDILTRSMTGMFRWQNTFMRHFNEMVAESEKLEKRDMEKSGADWARELFLLREQEMMHQDGGSSWRQNEQETVTLGQMLSALFDIRDFKPVKLLICAQGIVSEVSVEHICDYDMSQSLIAAGQFVCNESILYLTYYDRRREDKERQLTITLNAANRGEHSLYYRVSLMSIPLSVQRMIPQDSSENQPLMRSVLVAYDLTNPEERLNEFRYMWKEARQKVKNGEGNTLTEEQRLISDCLDPKVSYQIYRGKVLFRQKRYYEATLYLENAFRVLEPTVKQMTSAARDHFFEVSYLIGFCWTELEEYARAYYYLELIMPLHRVSYIEGYINCMVNSNDFRAIDIIDGMLIDIENAQSEIDETAPQQNIVLLANFLKRRKAYIYVSQHRYEEAEALLKNMLDDPDNSDFALNELAFIQRMKK